ncbi:hypothetical protein L0337_17375 [candidate division KSB1 bacterium]|nr:hypothetical protein [candidate division KSB1 bacterium]
MNIENHKSQSLPSFGKNDEQESFTELPSVTMRILAERVFLFSLLLLCCAFSPTSKCTQTFELLAKTARVLWIALDVNGGECRYSRLIQLIVTDSTVVEIPPTPLAKFRDWEAIKNAVKHFQAETPIELKASDGRWSASSLSWTFKTPESNSQLLERYKEFHGKFGGRDGRRWNHTMGKAGIDLPFFSDANMKLIYAFPAGLYVNYQISRVFFFKSSGDLLIFTQQEILADGLNTMHGFLLLKKY